ncbi:MAG: hypothetical protein M1294_05840 [Firmicutes bacterium]|nr:hypothetical protein [Bacillota bacterium]
MTHQGASRWSGRFWIRVEEQDPLTSDAEALGCILTDWIAQHVLPDAIVCDGKTLWESSSIFVKPRFLVASVVQSTTRICVQTAGNENRTRFLRWTRLLEPLDPTGRLVTADALHT